MPPKTRREEDVLVVGVAVMVVVVVEAVLDDARKVLPAPPRPQRMKLVEEGEGSVRRYFDILNGWQEGVTLALLGKRSLIDFFLLNSGVNRSRDRLIELSKWRSRWPSKAMLMYLRVYHSVVVRESTSNM